MDDTIKITEFMYNRKPDSWYKEKIPLIIDRLSMMACLSLFDLALRHPRMPETTKSIGVKMGKQFLDRLLHDGMHMPEDCLAVYKETFKLDEKPEAPAPDPQDPQAIEEERKHTSYLGDGLYCKFDGFGFWLLANDHRNPTDRCYLEPSVYTAFRAFVELYYPEQKEE